MLVSIIVLMVSLLLWKLIAIKFTVTTAVNPLSSTVHYTQRYSVAFKKAKYFMFLQKKKKSPCYFFPPSKTSACWKQCHVVTRATFPPLDEEKEKTIKMWLPPGRLYSSEFITKKVQTVDVKKSDLWLRSDEYNKSERTVEYLMCTWNYFDTDWECCST